MTTGDDAQPRSLPIAFLEGLAVALRESAEGLHEETGLHYDAVGNRTGRWLNGAVEQSITVTSNSNRLSTINGVAIGYDPAGNVLADHAAHGFTYNDLNRLSAASVNGQTMATFSYNALGQRVRKLDSTTGKVTLFQYGIGGELLAELRKRSDGTRELEREYLWLESLPVAMAERTYAADGTTVVASQFVYLHADHLGTPRLATDALQRVVWRWRSDAFGIGAAEMNPDGDSIATNVPLRFPGQYLDGETGLQYNYFRDYDPTLGRYIESDPLGLIAGANTFGYGFQNPLLNFDPDGLEVRFICREVLGVPTKAQHCFVFVSCPAEGWSRVLSLFRAESGSQKRRGYKYGYTPGDSAAAARQADFRRDRPAHPGNTFDGEVEPPQCYVESCGYEREVLGRFHRFPSHYVPYAWPGPNSNTFADYLIGRGARPSNAPSGSWINGAPGINADPGEFFK